MQGAPAPEARRPLPQLPGGGVRGLLWQLLLLLGVSVLVLGLPAVLPGALPRLNHHSAPVVLSKVGPLDVCGDRANVLSSVRQHYQG